jgi:hypothetical protein
VLTEGWGSFCDLPELRFHKRRRPGGKLGDAQAVNCPNCAQQQGNPSLHVEQHSNGISQDFLLGSSKLGLERIRARLLDLTNRNRLLNFRHSTRSTLNIVGTYPNIVFDALIEGENLNFRPVPEPPASLTPKPRVSDYAASKGIPTSVELPLPSNLPVSQSRRSRELQVLDYPDDLEALLRRISSSARTAIEESGTNMLHLVFGFLEWFESDVSEEAHLAPLLLIPVSIKRERSARAVRYFYLRTILFIG